MNLKEKMAKAVFCKIAPDEAWAVDIVWSGDSESAKKMKKEPCEIVDAVLLTLLQHIEGGAPELVEAYEKGFLKASSKFKTGKECTRAGLAAVVRKAMEG